MSKPKLDKNGWPVDGSPLYFEDMSDAVIKLLKSAYKLQRKNRNKTLVYKGPDNTAQHCCPSIHERLKAESLAYEQEDQGRNALEIIIGHAIQIGIEQGERIFKTGTEYKVMELLSRFGKDRMEGSNNATT